MHPFVDVLILVYAFKVSNNEFLISGYSETSSDYVLIQGQIFKLNMIIYIVYE